MIVRSVMDEARLLMTSLGREPTHAGHFAWLALTLFEARREHHRFGGEHGLLLELAGCLHDIGWRASPSGKGHHKESARLIWEHSWECLDTHSIQLVAMVARYDRKQIPSLEHAECFSLASGDRELVQTLPVC